LETVFVQRQPSPTLDLVDTLGSARQEIEKFLSKQTQLMTPLQIARSTELNENTMRRELQAMFKAGVVRKDMNHGYSLDISASMCASLDLVAMLCFATSRHARTRRDEIAVLTFSDAETPEFLIKPCKDYERVRPILEKLEGGGSTYFGPPLRWVNRYSAEKRFKPTAIIFSDTMIADDDRTLEELGKTREDLHGTPILLNTEARDDLWVRTAMQRSILENFHVDQDHLGDVQKILTHIVT
jgi:Mg-chelatase subunit ChlD